MTDQLEPEIVLYDLACIKNVCFSPVVWRIRLMLNYKRIPYRAIFLEFPDIEPTLKGLGIFPSAAAKNKYTVPAIHHVPSNTYIMDSDPISHFLETTYPDPPVPLSSALGDEISTTARARVGPHLATLIMPREIHILSARSQEYFRRTREAALGHPLEDLLAPAKQDRAWQRVEEGRGPVGELLQTHKADGPFVLGARPSYADFFVAGSLQCIRVVDEGVFERMVRAPGYREVYEACEPWMERRD